MRRKDKQQSKLKKWVRLPKTLCNCTGKNGSSNVICPAPQTRKGLGVVGRSKSGGDAGNVGAEEEEEKGGGVGKNRAVLRRSYSVGVGKMGRIDEEKPCEFMEDVQTLSHVSSVCPRTRYYAAAMRALS